MSRWRRPNFAITLLRSPKLPANMASFIVPLNFNKLDLKDYLWNAYKLPVLSVRSFVIQQPIREDKPGVQRPRRIWYRPRSTKRMIVEMGEGEHGGPFVWPDEVEDFADWDKEMYDTVNNPDEDLRKRSMERRLGTGKPKDADKLKEQARKLLEGETKWQPSWKEWGDGKVTEVETDLDINAEPAQRQRPAPAPARRESGEGDSGGGSFIPIPVPV